MANPILSKAPGAPLAPAGDSAAAGPAKTGESKFDKVRARLIDEQAHKVEIPPEVREISPQRMESLHAHLAQKVRNPASVQEVFRGEMAGAKQKVENLASRVNALPKTPAFQPFRDRLASVDAQYQRAGQLVNSLKGSESPGDLMKIQVQMYQLAENLELMSKVVEQVSSGVKNVIQTQV